MVIGAANPHGFLTVYNVLLYFKNERKRDMKKKLTIIYLKTLFTKFMFS